MPSTNTSTQFTNLQWGPAKRRVSRVIGGQDDPDIIEEAGEVLSDVLSEWNNSRSWNFLLILADDIAVTGGTQKYDLPTNFRSPYSAVLVNSGVVLAYKDRRTWTRITGTDETFAGAACYTCYDSASTGKVELLPNTASDVLRLRYYRPIIVNYTEDQAYVDILERYKTAILDGARARLLAEHGDESAKLQYFVAKSEDGYKKAIADDSTVPDRDLAFIPGIINSQAVLTGGSEIYP